MIKVNICYLNNEPNGLIIKGHSGKDKYGHDLVCASVSAIITGGFNSFDDDEILDVHLEEGNASIHVKQNEKTIIKLNVIITQLKTVMESEKDYLVIL